MDALPEPKLRDKIYLYIEARRLQQEAVDGPVESWYDEVEKIREILSTFTPERE